MSFCTDERILYKKWVVKLAGWGDKKTLTTDFTAHKKRGLQPFRKSN